MNGGRRWQGWRARARGFSLLVPALVAALGVVGCGGGSPTAAGAVPTVVVLRTAAAGAHVTPAPAPTAASAPTAAGAGPTVAAPYPTARPQPTGGPALGPGKDPTGVCQYGPPTLPRVSDGGLWSDGAASVYLVAEERHERSFAAWSRDVVAKIADDPTVRGYAAGRTDERADALRVDFVTAASPDQSIFAVPSRGTVATRPAAGTSGCALLIVYPQGQEGRYAPLVEAMVATLRATAP